MRFILALSAIALIAGPAAAQSSTGQKPSKTNGTTAAQDQDPGRQVPNDRDGLAARGGPDPTGSQNSFSETIGTQIGSTIGTTVNSEQPAPR